MDEIGSNVVKIKRFSSRNGHHHSPSHMNNNRISPTTELEDTVVDLHGKKAKDKDKWKGWRGKKARRSSSTNSGQKPLSKRSIRKNFYRIIAQRDCCKFIPEDPKLRPGKCRCGLMQADHPKKNVITDLTATVWKPETCTRPKRTTCYGELEFACDNNKNKRKKNYVRCAHDTPVETLLDMMKVDWKLKVPNLVISVTGGALSFSLKANLKNAFTKGLLKVATSTSAWIITAGTNAGVMKHVGDAFSKYGGVGSSEISLFGFAPWSALNGKETLKNPFISAKKNKWKDIHFAPPVQYSFAENKTGLDINHTHFILVDNGTTGKYGTEIELRSRFEAIISKQNTESSSFTGKVDVPVVILCLEGGPNTIKTMAEAVKNNTPAVVIGGSGRAADVVTYAYNHLESDDFGCSFIMTEYVDLVKDEIRRLLKPREEKQVEDIFQDVKDILKDITMVTVFVLDDQSGRHSDMDLAILQALLKANNIPRKVKDKIKLLQKGHDECFATNLVRFAKKCSESTNHGYKVKNGAVTEVKSKITEVFGSKITEDVYKQLEGLLLDEEKVTRYIGDGKINLYDFTILTHLLKDIYALEATKTSFQMQLKLALAWNRIDVAKSEIFSADFRSRLPIRSFESAWLHDSMLAAILDDKFDFVQCFLTEGLILKDFLTLENLSTLYRNIYSNSPFGTVIAGLNKWKQSEKEQGLKQITMFDVARVMEELMGDRFVCRYRFEPYNEFMTEKKYSVAGKDASTLSSSNSNSKQITIPEPEIDLFTWAILCNRRELAKLIWDNVEDSVACALMASKLLKELAEKVADDKTVTDTIDDLLDHANIYEVLAVGVLDECRKEDDDLAQKLVVKELENFGGLTNLDIAVSADNQEFIAHPSCQTLLSRLWMGALDINTSFWRVLPCIFFPFLIQFICVFNEEDNGNKSNFEEGEDITIYENELYEDDDDNMSLNTSMQGSRESFLALRENSKENDRNLETNFTEDHHFPEHFDDINNESGEAAFRKSDQMGYLDRIFYFYKAPFVKFITNVISYGCFLFIYSVIICSRFELEIHPFEYVLHAWVLTLIMEEVRQLLHQEPDSFFKKIEYYFSDMWNLVDFVSLTAFVVAAALRYVANANNDQNLLIASRIIFATDIVLFFLRLLQIFLVSRKMGPKIVMIRKMLDDLLYFVVILVVFILAYGVAMQAVLYPNTRSLLETFYNVWNRPYWQMYGELFYEDIFEPIRNHTTGQLLCEQEDPDDPCPDEYGRKVVPVYMAVYMLFTNILLLNLLIAIFNNTYEKVQENSDRVWKFRRYDVISEYNDRPAFMPPLIAISHLYFLGFYLYRRCCQSRMKNRHKGSSLKKKLTVEESKDLRKWERGILEMYVYSIEKRNADTQDERVKTILKRVTTISKNGNETSFGAEPRAQTAARPETRHGGRNAIMSIETRLGDLERNVEHILELMMQMNQRQGMILSGDRVEKKDSKRSVSFADEEPTICITSIHTKARLPIYPGNSIVKRFKVPDDKVLWENDFPEYDPVDYTAAFVLDQPYWADQNIMTLPPDLMPPIPYNQYDGACKVNRKSHVGKYDVVDGLPRNPYGRTGVIGRGNLGRFGPNHAADPIATRWKRSSSGIDVDKSKKRILEFIAIQRRDNQQWAIPGGMVEPGENVSETLRKEFTEEALAKLDMDKANRDALSQRISQLFSNGTEVYKGYVDDPRNTDNAWMETVACNFHDDTGEVFGEFQLKAGDDAQAVRWQRVSGNIPLFASHVGILEQVAKMHNASFY